MFINLTRQPVYWIDGMKVSRRHFEETGQYLQEQLIDLAAHQVNDYNYGITTAEKSFDLSVFCEYNQQISVELRSCRAITRSGMRIQVSPLDAVCLYTDFKKIADKFNLQTSQAQDLFIILAIDPFNRIPAGEPDISETPPRHPYAKAALVLDIIPAEFLNVNQLANGLVIGKIICRNGEIFQDKEFIPPCTSVASVPGLYDSYRTCRQLMESWESCCIRIITKINSRPSSHQLTAFASAIQKLSEKILEKLTGQKTSFQWTVQSAPPLYLCMILMENIQLVHALLQCFPEKERSGMLDFFAEWKETTPAAIETGTLATLSIQYDHNNITGTLTEILKSYTMYVEIFQKLSVIDIPGSQRRSQTVVIGESTEAENSSISTLQTQKKTVRWSPCD
jgi:hypothetical protein